jgi:hypothetical protein
METAERIPLMHTGETAETEPSNEEMAPDAVDANRISFDGKSVYAIVAGAVGVVVTALIVMFGVRGDVARVQSDVRDILTTMELQVKLGEAQSKLQEERLLQMKHGLDSMERRQEMLRLQYEELKDAMLKQGILR